MFSILVIILSILFDKWGLYVGPALYLLFLLSQNVIRNELIYSEGSSFGVLEYLSDFYYFFPILYISFVSFVDVNIMSFFMVLFFIKNYNKIDYKDKIFLLLFFFIAMFPFSVYLFSILLLYSSIKKDYDRSILFLVFTLVSILFIKIDILSFGSVLQSIIFSLLTGLGLLYILKEGYKYG